MDKIQNAIKNIIIIQYVYNVEKMIIKGNRNELVHNLCKMFVIFTVDVVHRQL